MFMLVIESGSWQTPTHSAICLALERIFSTTSLRDLSKHYVLFVVVVLILLLLSLLIIVYYRLNSIITIAFIFIALK